MFYFKCTYRLKSEWQRNIPAHPQSDSSHCTNVSSFPVSNLLSPTHPRRPGRNGGPIGSQEGLCFEGVWGKSAQSASTSAARRMPLKQLNQTHSLTHFTTAGFQREELTGSDTILSQTALWEQTWPTVTRQHRNNPQDTVSMNPQTWAKTQKSPLKHFHRCTRHNNGRKPFWNGCRTLSFSGWWITDEWGKKKDKTHDVHVEGSGPVLSSVLEMCQSGWLVIWQQTSQLVRFN